MRNYQHRWEEYKRAIEKRAMDHPIRWVAITVTFAFLAGLNTICALFGRDFLRPFSIAIAIYAVMTSYVCVALLSLALVRALRQQNNRTDSQEKA
jgi:hypothetical protein